MEENLQTTETIKENADIPEVNDSLENADIPTETGKAKKPKKPRTYGRGILTGILIAFGVFILAAGIFALILFGVIRNPFSYKNKEVAVEEIADNTGLDLNKVNLKLTMLKSLVENRFLFEADAEAAEEGIYKGYMSSLGDKYTTYYTVDEYKELQVSTTGYFGGIGAVISQSSDGILTIGRIYEGCPAEKAGLQVGDIIYYVDDLYAYDYTMDELVEDHIRGIPGTTLTMTVLRGEDQEEVVVELTRDIIDIPLVDSEVTDDNIGVIVLEQFATSASAQFKEAVDELVDEKGVKGLIIDLRGNPGGMLTCAVEIAGYLLPDDANEGLITYTADKNGEGEKFYKLDGHQLDIPVAILVNGSSASASEVFTGAMMDGYPKLKVIGEQTFGKGIVQEILPLGDGSAVKITTEHYYTPSGFDLHGEGLKPDILVELKPECRMYMDENDNQYNKAVDVINNWK